MSKPAVAFLLAAAPVALLAQSPTPAVEPRVAQLRDAALEDDYAWDIVEGLTTEIGPRLAGTPDEARARAWAAAKLFALGFAGVRIESFDMPVWARGAERAEILAPFPQPLVLTALGNSGATPPGGITAEVVGFDAWPTPCVSRNGRASRLLRTPCRRHGRLQLWRLTRSRSLGHVVKALRVRDLSARSARISPHRNRVLL